MSAKQKIDKTVAASAKRRRAKPTSREIEEQFDFPIDAKRILNVQLSIASAPRVGPGPRPKTDEILLHHRLSKNQVLTISSSIASLTPRPDDYG